MINARTASGEIEALKDALGQKTRAMKDFGEWCERQRAEFEAQLKIARVKERVYLNEIRALLEERVASLGHAERTEPKP